MQRNKLKAPSLAAMLLASVAVLYVPMHVQAATDPTGLLRKAIDSERHVSYIGEVQNMQIGQEQSAVTVYRVEHLAPKFTRYWYLAPQALYGDSIVVRGETSYSIDLKRDNVTVQNNNVPENEVTLDTNFDLLLSNYRPLLAPDETIAGRRVNVILLANKHTGATMMKLYIDTETHLVLEKDQYASNGSLTSQVRFQQIRYTSAIPKAIFTVPQGLRTTQGAGHGAVSASYQAAVQNAGFTAQSPRYLPDGFVPTTADVSNAHGVRTLHILYSDGIRTLSLFENARGAAVDMSRYRPQTVKFTDRTGRSGKIVTRSANYIQAGTLTLFAWEEGRLHLALVGDLSLPELTKIAASIVP